LSVTNSAIDIGEALSVFILT